MRDRLSALVLALGLGTVGGALFNLIDLPLAWMIGSMAANTVAAMAGWRVSVAPRLRIGMIAVLGVMLGSAFTPDLVNHIGDWAISFAALAVYCVIAGGLAFLYYLRVVGFDPATAYFSAAPGGLQEMILIGNAMGGDDRQIALIHAMRVMLIVLVVPIWFRLFGDYDAAQRATSAVPFLAVSGFDLLLLAVSGAVGLFVAQLLRLPASTLVGALLGSAAIHLTGVTAARPPAELVSIAQVVVGAAIGCRFTGLPLARVLRSLRIAAGATLVMIAGSVIAALLLHPLLGIPTEALVLAFSPGGLAEMSLVALALGVDVAFVSSHHVFRIMLVVFLAPLAFRLVHRFSGPQPEVQKPSEPRDA
ncbi:MAG: AbrB family transcriptional regulator [Rhodospirillaceae bacterium]|nr:AbrB family transcriptional regulator [Rhodospirillaceae bacterium]MBT6118664.1 AbrB family transcriptional regulator [Rhodospirillaceae bacterium]